MWWNRGLIVLPIPGISSCPLPILLPLVRWHLMYNHNTSGSLRHHWQVGDTYEKGEKILKGEKISKNVSVFFFWNDIKNLWGKIGISMPNVRATGYFIAFNVSEDFLGCPRVILGIQSWQHLLYNSLWTHAIHRDWHTIAAPICALFYAGNYLTLTTLKLSNKNQTLADLNPNLLYE